MRKIKQKGVKKAAKAKQTPSTKTNVCKTIKNAYLFIPLLIISARCSCLYGKKKGGEKKTTKREGESEEKHFNKRFLFMY